MFDIACIIFAGGKSSRMGQDKSLLPFGESASLAQYQYERLGKLFSHVHLSAKDKNKFDFSPSVLEDPEGADFAPTAGFVAAFSALHTERIMVLSVDTPFVDKSVFEKLLASDSDDYDAIIAKTASGTHPMCGIYHASLFPELKRMFDDSDHRLGKLLSTVKTHYVSFEDESLFANLNHPHEYEAAVSCYNNKKVKESI